MREGIKINSGEIKELLTKHFGEPCGSLTIGKSKPSASDVIYFIEQTDAVKKAAVFRDEINSEISKKALKHWPSMTQRFDRDFLCKEKKPICVRFEQSVDRVKIDFMEMVGVRYHRTYKSRLAATLLTGKYSLISLDTSKAAVECDGNGILTEYQADIVENNENIGTYDGGENNDNISNSDEFEWENSDWKAESIENILGDFFDRYDYAGLYDDVLVTEGFSYGTNKAVFNHPSIRNFASDLLDTAGKQTGHYIICDAARAVREWGCFLLPVSFHEIIKYHTPAELISALVPGAELPGTNLNKPDLNEGYVKAMLSSIIDRGSLNVLEKLPKEVLKKAVDSGVLYRGVEPFGFIKGLYKCIFKNCDNYPDTYVCAADYVDMCFQLQSKVKLLFSPERIIKAHDAAEKEFNCQRIVESSDNELAAIPSKFDRLENCLEKLHPGEFFRIRTAEQLLREGNNQNNCVYLRRFLIKQDTAAVFHIKTKGGHDYTAQFSADHKGRYIINEIRAKNNLRCTEQDRNSLESTLDKINEPPDFSTVFQAFNF